MPWDAAVLKLGQLLQYPYNGLQVLKWKEESHIFYFKSKAKSD